jgi:hypothetical protein
MRGILELLTIPAFLNLNGNLKPLPQALVGALED